MRYKIAIKNSVINFIYFGLVIVIGLISQRIFLQYLGSEYNGIKSLMYNIVSVMSIVELGFGSAIIFSMYEPFSKNDAKKIRELLYYFRKIYNVIACLIFIIGIMIIPFIPLLVGETTIKMVYLIYALYLINTLLTYAFAYKKSLLIADQKNYIINIFNIIILIATNVIQIGYLIIMKDFIGFLVIMCIMTFINNYIIAKYVNKSYKKILSENKSELDKESKETIKTKVKGLFYHKIGAYAITSTDNIIISMTSGLGLKMVGYYYNYNMIISSVSMILSNAISTLTATIGNIFTEKDDSLNRNVYNALLFANNWIYGICSIMIMCLIEPFIELWIGKEYLLTSNILIIIVINMYVQGMRRTSEVFKESVGLYHEDRFVPVIEAILNIVLSIILANLMGLSGIFIGTILSSLIVYLYDYPKYVFGIILKEKKTNFFKLIIPYFGVTFINGIVNYLIVLNINFTNIFLQLFVSLLICFIVSNLIYIICFHKRIEFKYYFSIIEKTIKSKVKEKKKYEV